MEEEGKASRPRMEMCGFPDCQAGWGPPPQHCLTFWRGGKLEGRGAEEPPLAVGERRPRRRIGRKGGGHILFGGRMQERGGGPLTRTDRMRDSGKTAATDSMWIAHRRPHLPTNPPLFHHVTLLRLPCCCNTFSKFIIHEYVPHLESNYCRQQSASSQYHFLFVHQFS